MKFFFAFLVSVFLFVHPSFATTPTPVSPTAVAKNTSKTISFKEFKKTFKTQKRRHHGNPAPVYLAIALIGAAAVIALFFLVPGVSVILLGVIGAIAFIAFILFFVMSGAN